MTTLDAQTRSTPPGVHARYEHPAKVAAGIVVRVFLLFTAAVLGVVLILLVVLPQVMGWVPLTVLSGSMEPNIPVGSQVVVDRVETEDDLTQITTGEVISFMPVPDDPSLVTHRVVSQGVSGTGEITFVTKGDANDANDPDRVSLQQIRGVAKYTVPYAGYVASVLDVKQNGAGLIIVVSVLFMYAAWNVIAGLRERRKAEPPLDLDALNDLDTLDNPEAPDNTDGAAHMHDEVHR